MRPFWNHFIWHSRISSKFLSKYFKTVTSKVCHEVFVVPFASFFTVYYPFSFFYSILYNTEKSEFRFKIRKCELLICSTHLSTHTHIICKHTHRHPRTHIHTHPSTHAHIHDGAKKKLNYRTPLMIHIHITASSLLPVSQFVYHSVHLSVLPPICTSCLKVLFYTSQSTRRW